MQTARVGQSLNLNLFLSGATYEDEDGADTPRNLMLDPDPEDTPAGATLTRAGDLAWTPGLDQLGTHRLIVIAIDDGTPAMADVEFLTVMVIPGNSPPSFNLLGDPPSVLEDAGPQAVPGFATNISAGDDEPDQLVQFLVTENSNPTLFAALPSITSDGTLTYESAADANGTAEITVLLMDDGGTANGGVDRSAEASFTIEVVAVNDPPVITLPGAQAVDEDTTLAISGISMTDVEIVSQGGRAQMAMSVSNGLLTITETTGLTFTTGDGVADRSIGFLGTLAQINAAVATLSYEPDENFNGSDTLNVQGSDLGISGGGTQITNRALGISVAAINDPPTLIVPDALTVLTEEPTMINGIVVDDVDAADGSGGVQVTLSVTNGVLQAVGGGLMGQTITTTGSISVINSILTGLTYRSNMGFVGTDALTVTVNDQGNTGGPGPQSVTQSIEINVVSDANNPPNLLPIDDVTAFPGVPLVVPLSATDIDGDSLNFQFVGTVPAEAELIDNGDGTGLIRWTPMFADAGVHTFGVVVNDNGIPPKSDFEFFDVTVEEVLLVDTLEDEMDGDLSAGDVSLREAIELANLADGMQTVTFASSLSGGTIELLLGDLEVNDSLIIDGSALPVPLTIDASSSSRIFRVVETSGDFSLVGLVLTGGSATDRGGAIRVESDATLLIRNSRIEGNEAVEQGGAIDAVGSVFIEDTIIEANQTTGANGGGGAVFAASDLQVSRSRFQDNFATGEGGALLTSGFVAIDTTTFDANSSLANGGAIALTSGQLLVVDSTFSNNSRLGADVGGGGGAVAANGLMIRLTNTTVSGNEGTALVAAAIALENVTVVDNTGGGVRGTESITISNSIVAGNISVMGGPDINPVGGATLDASFSLIGDNAGTDLIASDIADVDGNLIGSAAGAGVIDPLIGLLADNGGGTFTHVLLEGSPAIDAGDPNYAGGLVSDQRGLPFVRVADGNGDLTLRLDMGAWERQELPAALFVVDTLEDELDGNMDAGDRSLREVLQLAATTGGERTITFADDLNGATLSLMMGELEISSAVTIDASGLAEGLTIDARGESRVVHITAATADVSLVGLNIIGGQTMGAGEVNGGGGIRSITSGLVSLDRVTLDGNRALGDSAHGGGISATGPLGISRSTISNNVAMGMQADGGGIWASELITLSNATISGNESRGEGGGIRAWDDLIARNSTVVRNRTVGDSTTGGGIRGGSNVTPTMAMLELSSTILAFNTLRAFNIDFASDVLWPNGLIMADHSLVGNRVGTNLVESQTPDANGNLIGNQGGGGLINPQLGELVNNGGRTRTHLPLALSPVIDAGTANGLSIDQRGALRTVDEPSTMDADDGTDMGAVEVQPSTAVRSGFGERQLWSIAGRDHRATDTSRTPHASIVDQAFALKWNAV